MMISAVEMKALCQRRASRSWLFVKEPPTLVHQVGPPQCSERQKIKVTTSQRPHRMETHCESLVLMMLRLMCVMLSRNEVLAGLAWI
jgi:hypothetical protein